MSPLAPASPPALSALPGAAGPAGTSGPAPLPAPGYSGLQPCVHCGFCLPACPTYEATGDESDSPRGRIVLMRSLAAGELPASDEALQLHLDRCLGCRACEPVCPSGVVYGPALEAARAEIAARARPLSAAVRLFLWMVERPERQRAPWRIARAARALRLPELLARGAGPRAPRPVGVLAMLAATRPPGPRATSARRAARRPPRSPAAAARAGPDDPVALFSGCVMDGLFGHVHAATVRALGMNGIRILPVPGQVCCGALHAHAGLSERSRQLALQNVAAFDAAAPRLPVVTNSAGCGAALKAYGEWLADDPLAERAHAFAARVRDATEVLADRGPAAAGPLPLRAAYDAPCHLLHAQRVDAAPRAVLAAIAELDLVPLEGWDRCCGSAGLYSLLEPELASQVLEAKLSAIRDAAPEIVVTGNPGCLMQIGAGALLSELDVEVRHPLELLDLAYGAQRV